MAENDSPGLETVCDSQLSAPDEGVTTDSVSELQLASYVHDAVEQLKQQHPNIVFRSGRRGVEEQARAMAANVARNRRWIEETYSATAERQLLQAWVDANPNATGAGEIAAGLSALMKDWDDERKSHLSLHFSGQAVDIQPIAGQDGEAVKDAIRGLPNFRKFLDHEGGLTIWHTEFQERS